MIRPPRTTLEVRELIQRFNAPVGEVRPGVKRQRCRTCRGYLWITGTKVHAIDGLYCALTCSKWTRDEIVMFDAYYAERNRHCGCSGSSGRKIMYESEQEAIENIRVPLALRVYRCDYDSRYFHLTGKTKRARWNAHVLDA